MSMQRPRDDDDSLVRGAGKAKQGTKSKKVGGERLGIGDGATGKARQLKKEKTDNE
jgi:hypothetical protein